VARLLSRVNTYDGLRYGEHPAVHAWELLNEPRASRLDREGRALRSWVDEVGAVVKAHAPMHLVGTGEEGFGPSFGLNTASPFVDLASVHFYPELWGTPPEHIASEGARWFSEHAALARELGKPLFIGEFALRNEGALALDERRALYRGWFRCAWRSGIGASAPWMFAYDDDHTFYFRDGTVPADARNRYADILIESAALTRTR